MFAHPPEGQLFFFVEKFWGFIGDFYKKSPMQVRTESATFPVWAKPTTLEPRDLPPHPLGTVAGVEMIW